MTTFPHYLHTLDYLPLKNLFIPSEMPSSKLMVILHGRGGKSEDFEWIADFLACDEMHYLILEAPAVYEDGYSWYDDIPYHFEGLKTSSQLLTQTFDILFEEDFDVRQSFIFGFSQGALLTFEFGGRYQKSLLGYIAVSGHLENPKKLLEELNPDVKNAHWLCTHGKEDEALDFDTAKAQIEVLQHGGLPIEFKAYDKAHEITREEMGMIGKWMGECLEK